jgi:plasmid stability protein
MAQLVVRHFNESLKTRLKRRAKRHGRSLEAEVLDILRQAVEDEKSNRVGLGTFIARTFAGKGIDFEIPEWRGEEARPATFRRTFSRSTKSRS